MLSCLEAALHALKQKFSHVTKLIVQSDNAKNLAGKQTKLLLPYVCSAAGLKLIAYYHNKAQSSKDACDTHFSYQQTQSGCLPDAGDEGRKVSTPRQLAVALINASVSNTTKLSGSCSDSSGGWNFQVLCCLVCNICRKATGPVLQLPRTDDSISLCVKLTDYTHGINFTGVTVTLNKEARKDEK